MFHVNLPGCTSIYHFMPVSGRLFERCVDVGQHPPATVARPSGTVKHLEHPEFSETVRNCKRWAANVGVVCVYIYCILNMSVSWCVSTWALKAISLALKWTILKGLGASFETCPICASINHVFQDQRKNVFISQWSGLRSTKTRFFCPGGDPSKDAIYLDIFGDTEWGMEPMSTLRADFAESAQRQERNRGFPRRKREGNPGAKKKSQVFLCSCVFFLKENCGNSWKFMACFPDFVWFVRDENPIPTLNGETSIFQPLSRRSASRSTRGKSLKVLKAIQYTLPENNIAPWKCVWLLIIQ